ncbi:histidine phosphatase family protein [Candidatus Harpocratesius sp.]
MKIALIRHAQTTWNKLKKVQGQADPPLSKEGREQAQKLHERIASELSQYSVIYSSPMKRALETAELIQGKSQVPIKIDNRLRSRNLGLFSGKTLESIQKKYPQEFILWRTGVPSFCPPNGEPTRLMLEKLIDFLDFIKNSHSSDESIMIVTHRESVGALMRMLSNSQIDSLTQIENCKPYYFKV